jgi:hypothetical protein
MNQHIITDEELDNIADLLRRCAVFQSVIDALLDPADSRPYQSERDKVLDELVEWRIEYMKTRGRGFAEYLAAEGRKIAELRQQAGD